MFYFITGSLYLNPFHSFPPPNLTPFWQPPICSPCLWVWVSSCFFFFFNSAYKSAREGQNTAWFHCMKQTILSHFHHFTISVGDDKMLKRMGHFRQTHFRRHISDWLIARRSICFLFSFLILGKTKNTGTRNICKVFSNSIYFWLSELSCEGRCWNAGDVEFQLSVCLSWGYSPEGAPRFSGPPLRGKVGPFHAVKWLHTVNTKAE